MIRAGVAFVVLSLAPMQCARSHGADDRMEDTAGDALWDLADTCRKEENASCEKRALRYLVERYPSNRHAESARERLGAATPASPSASAQSP